MKLFIWLALCLPFSVVSPAAANEEMEGRGEERVDGPENSDPERYLEHLEEGLGLDAKQKEKVRAAFAESDKRSKSKRAELKALQEKAHALRKDLNEERRRRDEAVRELLTLDQKDRFDALRMGRHRRQPEGGGSSERRRYWEEKEERGGERRERFERRFKGGDERDPSRFPPEMWHEHREPGGRPSERDPRMNPKPGDQPPGAPPEPGD
ncbi:MAG: hypothetical protein HYZ75_06430 [Elusimicrobia bacterium]|nr:hypothetical protein [Elusimicrobiota bacterium]